MAADHSFTNYVSKRFDNNFWAVANQYLNDNADSLCSDLRRIHRAGEMEISIIGPRIQASTENFKSA